MVSNLAKIAEIYCTVNINKDNLSFTVTGDDLQTMFAEFGKVQEAKIISDRRTNQSKGCVFVEMPGNAKADQAIKALNGKFIDGRNIRKSIQPIRGAILYVRP